MSTVPVGRFLKDISSDPVRSGPISLSDYISMPDHHGRQSDISAKIEEAHIQGVLEGRAEAQAEFDRRLNARVAELEAAFAAERAKWVKAEAELLRGALLEALNSSHDAIAGQVAKVLQPFVEARTRERAMGELKTLLDQILFKGDYRKITVQGPEDLVSTLKERIGEDVSGISYSVDEAADLTVAADETILEARISAWVDAIRGDA